MATLEDIKNGLDPDVVKIVDEIKQRFPNAKMTSGFRAGAKTTDGKVSRHSKGEAADFRIDNDVLKFLESKEGAELLYKYGLGYIDESLPQNKKWGNAIHIGKDTIPVQKTIERYKSFNNTEPTTTSNTGVVDSAYNPILVESAPQEKKEVKVENNLDKEVQKILEQTKKVDAFLKEMYSEDNGIDSNIYEQEEPTSNIQMADVAGIYNEASNFIDTPIAQQGGTWQRHLMDLNRLQNENRQKQGGIRNLLNGINSTINNKKAINYNTESNERVVDNARVVKKPILEINRIARNKTDKEIADERKYLREEAGKKDTFSNLINPNRQVISDIAKGLESEYRFSDEPNFVDDYINPANMIGVMASNLGQAPLQAEQSNSYMPYLTSIGAPLVTGALAGIGTQNTGQFVNNLANPLAGTGDLARGVYNKGVNALDNLTNKTVSDVTKPSYVKTFLTGEKKNKELNNKLLNLIIEQDARASMYANELNSISHSATIKKSANTNYKVAPYFDVDIDKIPLAHRLDNTGEFSKKVDNYISKQQRSVRGVDGLDYETSLKALVESDNSGNKMLGRGLYVSNSEDIGREFSRNNGLIGVLEHNYNVTGKNPMERLSDLNRKSYVEDWHLTSNELKALGKKEGVMYKDLSDAELNSINKYYKNSKYAHGAAVQRANTTVEQPKIVNVIENSGNLPKSKVINVDLFDTYSKNYSEAPILRWRQSKKVEPRYGYKKYEEFGKLRDRINRDKATAIKIGSLMGAGVIGIGAMKYLEDVETKQQGGEKIIDDNMGQYNHPGKVTRISSPYITMKDVPYDILAIADNGEKRIMKPNEEHYFKNAKTVTEYPILTEAEKRFLKEINKK